MTGETLINSSTIGLLGTAMLLAYYAINLKDEWIPIKLLCFGSSFYLALIMINFNYVALSNEAVPWVAAVLDNLVTAYQLMLWITRVFIGFTLLYIIWWLFNIFKEYSDKKKKAKYEDEPKPY